MIGDTLVKLWALEIAKILLVEDAAKQLSQVSFSNNTVHQEIIAMSQDILTQTVNEIKQNPSNKTQIVNEIKQVLYRQALTSKTLSKKLKEVTGIVVQTVNFIHGHALNHRLFQEFCNGAEHSVLLYDTEVHWWSHDHIFTYVVELRNEVLKFFLHQQSSPSQSF